MSSRGFDTNTSVVHLIPTILREGYSFVGRYYSHTPDKNLTKAEAQALSNAGIYIVSIWETNPTQITYFTRAKGVQDAHDALNMAYDIGQPKDTPIYFAVDVDFDETHPLIVAAYFAGIQKYFADAGSPFTVGVYGSGDVCKMLKERGFVSHTWLAQSRGWNGTLEYHDWNLLQGPEKTWHGISIDPLVSQGNGGGWKLP